jgi:hypothetical protein
VWLHSQKAVTPYILVMIGVILLLPTLLPL